MGNKNTKNIVEELRDSLSSAEATANYLGLDEVTMLIGVAKLSLEDQLLTDAEGQGFGDGQAERMAV